MDTARGRLRPRLSPATAMAATDAVMADMVATGVVATDMARGLLMPSLRLTPLLRLVTAAAMVMVVMAAATAATDAAMAAMVATGVAVTDTARGRLRPSPATAMAVMAADMVVTAAMGLRLRPWIRLRQEGG